MNILHVITGLQKAAGTTTFVENVVREQRSLGHTVDIVTNANQKEYFNSTVHLHLSPSPDQPLTPNPQPLTPNIIHIHGLWSPLLHRASRFARSHHIPVVWSTHGMTAPWSLHHKWWKKCLPWCFYQKPDLKRAALIHCTTDLEADWNHALGLHNTFIAPLGTNLRGPLRAASPLLRNLPSEAELLRRMCRGGEVEKGWGCGHRAMAEKKVEEWLKGVDEATFGVALESFVVDGVLNGIIRLRDASERDLIIDGAKKFFAEFSKLILQLSDFRCVYFAPDPRSRNRGITNSMAWAEYAVHAVTNGGVLIPGKEFHTRWYNRRKVENFDRIGGTLLSERCAPVLKNNPVADAIKFFGETHDGGDFDVVVRLDEYGNAEANMTEVTFEASKTKKRFPRLKPLSEAIETVVCHQAAGTNPAIVGDSIANPLSPRKGVEKKSCGEELEKDGRGASPIAPAARTLLYVGRIYPVKALDNLIRAFALAVKEYSRVERGERVDWVLRIVGPDQAGHLQELKDLVHSLCPCDSVLKIEFPGPKFDADLDAEYENCTALALVSHTENFGATVVDALAHAKPVITSTNTPWKIVLGNSTIPHSSFLIPHSAPGRCGWWVDNDPETLSKTLLELFSTSTSDLNLLGQNGLALVKQSYTWPAIARNLLSHYQSLTPNP